MKDELSVFPITVFIPEICQTLKNSDSHSLVLTAETGAGKSTILPLGLLEQFEGKILMCEPRRLAVLGIANRVSDLLGEEWGETVGYKIHLENKISEKTRLELVTEAILVKNLQKDPALENYNLVVLDEFHERSIYTDLALAFLKEAMELRDDLFVIVMSATIDSKKVSEYLGNAPVISVPGRTFPVRVLYDDKHDAVSVALSELEKSEGNILIFQPGIKEIRKCERELKEELKDVENVEVLILHSSLSLNEQRKVLKKETDGKRRIIVSSAIAETSLTVNGVTTVIDSGLARVNKINLNTGMSDLVTETESMFSAEQRKGRAGREQEGKCIRLWNEFDPRKKDFPPEILRTDLAELVLECADRGIFNREKIDWLDMPGEAAWKTAQDLLKLLHLIRQDGHITEKGKAALSLGLHPRLASVAIEGLVNDCSPDRFVLQYSSYSSSSEEIQRRFLEDLKRRLSRLDCKKLRPDCEIYENQRLLILAGFPDRVAKKVSDENAEFVEFQFFSGRKGRIYRNLQGQNNQKFLKNGIEWIAAPQVLAGKTEAVIFEFEEFDNEIINKWLENRTEKKEVCSFEDGRIVKQEIVCYGEIVISSKKIKADNNDFAAAWCTEVQKKGLDVLPQNDKIFRLLLRAKFYFQQKSDLDTESEDFENRLVDKVNEWLLPFVTGSKLTEDMVYQSLYWFLNGAELDKEVPEQIELSNGRKCRVKYEKVSSPEDVKKLIIRPVIEIIIQRIFGCFVTPEVAGMKVLLKLLSPASRPLQITDDLENFWNGAWIEICKEMKGRYPKHNWDYRVTEKD